MGAAPNAPPSSTSLEAAPNVRLWGQRPPEITGAIDAAWEGLATRKPEGYVTIGRERYSYGIADRINTDAIVTTLLEERSDNTPLELLDVGTGTRQFLNRIYKHYDGAVNAHGVTAHDFWSGDDQGASPIDYQIANAEYLSEVYEPNTFHAAVSNFTLRHLVDPLGTLAQIYETTRPGGVIAVDAFDTPGVTDSLPTIVEQLNQQGYRVVADYEYHLTDTGMAITRCMTLLIRKTYDHLDLPISYAGLTPREHSGYRAAYSTTAEPVQLSLPPALMGVRQKLTDLYGEQGIRIDREKEIFEPLLSRDPMYSATRQHRDWTGYIHDAMLAGEDPSKLQQMQEVLKLLDSGIPEWIAKYRDRSTFSQAVSERIGLPTQSVRLFG